MENENNDKSNYKIFDNENIKIETKALRPCCACPETRNLRDECIRNKSEEECFDFIESHNQCLRKLGFKV